MVEALLAVCQRFFRRVLFFIVREPWVLGWSGAGEGVDRPLVASLEVPLDQPSIFRTVTRDRSLFIGRLGPEEENQRFLKALGKRPQSSAVLLPVVVRSRVVNLVYGDNGAADRVRGDLGELMVAAAEGAARLPADHPQARRRRAEAVGRGTGRRRKER